MRARISALLRVSGLPGWARDALRHRIYQHSHKAEAILDLIEGLAFELEAQPGQFRFLKPDWDAYWMASYEDFLIHE